MEKYHILLAMPGPNIRFHTAQSAFFSAGKNHHVEIAGADQASWDNMNMLWVTALNAAKHDGVTHFAMLHADIVPDLDQDWVQILIEEMESKAASFTSAVVPIKDGRGLTSCGIGNPADPWFPYRRFTMREIHAFPETFTQDDIGYEGYQLNHNSGLVMADLRDPVFWSTKPTGELEIWFEFRKKCYVDGDGAARLKCESEDWNFSRRLWKNRVRSCITRKVNVHHYGMTGYPSSYPWGKHAHDEATQPTWGPNDPIGDNVAEVDEDHSVYGMRPQDGLI